MKRFCFVIAAAGLMLLAAQPAKACPTAFGLAIAGGGNPAFATPFAATFGGGTAYGFNNALGVDPFTVVNVNNRAFIGGRGFSGEFSRGIGLGRGRAFARGFVRGRRGF